MDWNQERVIFEVDGSTVLETNVSPIPPLAAVIWIDNQYAAFTPRVKWRLGHKQDRQPGWRSQTWN